MSLLEVGQVVRPHGLRGEVVVALVTTRLDRLAPGSALATRHDSRPAVPPTLVVASSRPHQSRHLVIFEGISTREEAESIRGVVLLAEPDEESDDLYVHQLIGKSLVDQRGNGRGRVVSVEANPASDLLVLDGGALVPLRFVVSVEGDTVVVEVPEGLFE